MCSTKIAHFAFCVINALNATHFEIKTGQMAVLAKASSSVLNKALKRRQNCKISPKKSKSIPLAPKFPVKHHNNTVKIQFNQKTINIVTLVNQLCSHAFTISY